MDYPTLAPCYNKACFINLIQHFMTGQNKSIFTDCEKKIAKLTMDGCSRKMIAVVLLISINTVHTHFRTMYAKVNVHNTAGFLKYLAENPSILYNEEVFLQPIAFPFV